jgi:hypothetical protein
MFEPSLLYSGCGLQQAETVYVRAIISKQDAHNLVWARGGQKPRLGIIDRQTTGEHE